MLKSVEVEFLGKPVVLECTHKRQFPPPQMYGHTPADIDVLWTQGALPQAEYHLLKTWQARCGLMVMGPKCMDCPLAVKKTPRPGRPKIFDTEPWLPAKRRLHWEDMAKKRKVHSAGVTSADEGG